MFVGRTWEENITGAFHVREHRKETRELLAEVDPSKSDQHQFSLNKRKSYEN